MRAGHRVRRAPVLRFGVALLGLRITVGQIAELGWGRSVLVVVSVSRDDRACRCWSRG